jgi:hypothetical protein
MTKAVITPEEGAELRRLYDKHVAASIHTGNVLRTHGMESFQFFETDRATGMIWRRIREILGD